MKLDLVVEKPKQKAGWTIPITLTPYVIGRDEHCQLRPANATVSKKHCAVLVRGERVFIRDLNSTNGTFLNDERIEEERELRDGDRLSVGRLRLRIVLQEPRPSEPPRQADSPAATDDETTAAALLLAVEEGGPGPGDLDLLDPAEVPAGSTVTLPPEASASAAEPAKPDPGPGTATSPPAATEADQVSISAVAQEILKAYKKPRRKE
jgi:predicted component of type VI protein secretion system